MAENKIFQEQPAQAVSKDGKKPMDTAALVLGIITIVAAALIPLVSYICGIIGLVFAIRHRKEKRTTAALILCIVGLVGAVISHVIAAAALMEIIGNTAG